MIEPASRPAALPPDEAPQLQCHAPDHVLPAGTGGARGKRVHGSNHDESTSPQLLRLGASDGELRVCWPR